MDPTHSGPDDSTFVNRSHAGRSQAQLPGQGRRETYAPRVRPDDVDFDSEKTLRDYIEIVIRRRWAVLAVSVLVLLTAAVYTFTVAPLYNSVATIEFEEKKPKQEDRVYGNPEYDQYKGYLATQLEILKSTSLAVALVNKMNLSESPEFAPKSTLIGRCLSALTSRFRSNDQEDQENAAAANMNRLTSAVLGRIAVKPVKTSNLATVSMDATTPAFANQMLSNYLDLYLQSNLEKRRKESLEASAWLKEELAKVEKKLMESQAELVGFLIDNGIVVSSTETGVSPVMDLLAKTMETHTKSQEARLRMQALRDQKVSSDTGIVLPKDVNTEYVGKLKEQLALFESEYSQMKGLYSPGYPKMAMLHQKIQFLKDRIVEIEKSIVSSALDTAKKEENLFQGSVDIAKEEANRVKALDAQHMLLKKEVETNEEFHKIILKEYKENDIKARTINNNVRIVDSPSRPTQARWPKKKLFLLIGALMGIVGGLAAAFFLDRLDNTIQTPEEIERDFRVRRLAIVPDLDALKKLHGTELTATPYEFIARQLPKSPMSDAIRNIQTSIFLSNQAHPVRCMVVSSPNPSQGKTLISVSIATVLCSGDKKVVIVDGDMRKPRVHRVFGHREPGRGLSNLLGGNGSQISDALHAHSIKGLYYITAGQTVSDHLPLLQSKYMKKLVDLLRRAFDYVIFDSPPVLGFSDTSILCTYADGLIMVAKQGHVGRDELREAINESSTVNGCAVLGVVLNKAHAPGAYGYGYRYGFGYGRGHYYGNYKYYGDKS